MKRILLAIAVILLLLITSLLPQITGLLATRSAKTGLVIDSTTGKPMPHVIVIAAGRVSAEPGFPVGQGGTKPLYRIVTSTDADGRYYIPAVWTNLDPFVDIPVPFRNQQWTWVITAFEIGYAVVGDEKTWQFDERGIGNYRPRSGLYVPPHSWAGSVIEVDPIRMYKPTLNLKEAAVYYSRIRTVGNPYRASTDPGDLAMRAEGYALLAPWVCALNSQQVIDVTTIASLSGFSSDKDRAYELLEMLAPGVARSDASQGRTTSAEIACKFITNGRGTP